MRRPARGGILGGVLAGVMALALPVPASAAGDKATREAEARFEEGLSRVKTHDFEAARLSFEQAYVVLKRPLILWNLALAEEKTGHSLDALHHFRQVAGEAEAALDRANAQRHVDALMTETAHLDLQAPAGAVLTLDGGAASWTAPVPEAVDVMPGRHVVVAKLQDGEKTSEVSATPGQLVHVSFFPSEQPSPAVVAPAPAAPAPAPVVSGAPMSTRAQSADAGTPSGEFWTPRVITTTVVGGTAVVALGLGVYFALASRSNASSALAFQNTYQRDTCSNPSPLTQATCKQWNDNVQAQNRDATVSDVFYVVGGAMVAAAAATWLLWPKDTHGTGAWLLPEFGPATAGLSAGGRF